MWTSRGRLDDAAVTYSSDSYAPTRSAVGSEPVVVNGLRFQLLSSAELASLDGAQWAALEASALAENPFYARTYVVGGLSTIDRKSHLCAFAFWSREGQLVGLFPMRRRFGIGLAAANTYQFSSTPLVHRDHAEAVVHEWMEAMRDPQFPRCWQFNNLQLDGVLYELIAETADRLGFYRANIDTYSRPQLTRLEGGFHAHLANVLSKSRRKELERCLRRLRELGTLRLERADSPDSVKSALEAFLVIENTGWKGQAGTAFLSKETHAAFARAAFRCDGLARGAIIDTLLLENRPIAVSINIVSGSTLFTPKCAYVEDLRSFAPGLVLEHLVIERFYSDSAYARMDSATTVGGHVVQGLWNTSVPMGTLFVGSPATTRVAAAIARLKVRLKLRARPLRDRIKSALKRGRQMARNRASPRNG